MPPERTGRTRPTKPKKQARAQKRKQRDVDVEQLEQAVSDLDASATFTKFSDLPLSEPTKAGLKSCHFSTLTDIQAKAIALGLKGSDILGAARTGSGKTLAFVVPVLENLYRQEWVGADAGLGAMIIAPTRELAIQIFDVLYKIGKHGHLFAAGLVIGGKSLQEEQQALIRMNIVVCTPGRMLQHLSQTATFNVDGLKMLVLDEADRIMDMGFQRDVDAIIEYLPPDRQTLLFSATQTKKVSDLARLSLRDPEYVSVHEAAATATPKSLQQNYVLTPLPEKLDTLWSFLQSSKKSKILVFLSSGKQVRFVYETFRHMQPGIPLLHLHGRQKQGARLEITTRFAGAKYSCLFATDVAARGLDFPAVDWVIQVDCPEDADTYIHRVGRTARYERDGRAVLLLDPSEEQGMLERLTTKKVPIERINVRGKKQRSIKDQLQAMCFKDPELKYLGQKAFASYVRSIHVHRDKEIFNVEEYPLEEFAASLGLPGAPKIKFLKADAAATKKTKNAPRRGASPSGSDVDDEDISGDPNGRKSKTAVRTKYDRMFERQNQDILTDHYKRMVDNEHEDVEDDRDSNEAEEATTTAAGDEDDLFTVKQRIPARKSPEPLSSSAKTASLVNKKTGEAVKADSNRQRRALLSRKGAAKVLGAESKRLIFDDETGDLREPDLPFKDPDEIDKQREKETYRAKELERMLDVDDTDRLVAKQKRRDKRDKRKERLRMEARGEVAVPAGDDERSQSGGDNDHDDEGHGDSDMQRPFAELAEFYPSDEESSKNTQPRSRVKAASSTPSPSAGDGAAEGEGGEAEKTSIEKARSTQRNSDYKLHDATLDPSPTVAPLLSARTAKVQNAENEHVVEPSRNEIGRIRDDLDPYGRMASPSHKRRSTATAFATASAPGGQWRRTSHTSLGGDDSTAAALRSRHDGDVATVDAAVPRRVHGPPDSGARRRQAQEEPPQAAAVPDSLQGLEDLARDLLR